MRKHEEKAVKHGPGHCEKVQHVGLGYLHDKDDDRIYDVDDIEYCGRCHRFIDKAEKGDEG